MTVLLISLFPVNPVYARSRLTPDVKKVLCLLVMPLDLEKYRPYVDHFDLSDAQKAELIQTVWSMMESFVDQAFGTHPVQQCEYDTEKIVQDSPGILDSKGITEEGPKL